MGWVILVTSKSDWQKIVKFQGPVRLGHDIVFFRMIGISVFIEEEEEEECFTCNECEKDFEEDDLIDGRCDDCHEQFSGSCEECGTELDLAGNDFESCSICQKFDFCSSCSYSRSRYSTGEYVVCDGCYCDYDEKMSEYLESPEKSSLGFREGNYDLYDTQEMW